MTYTEALKMIEIHGEYSQQYGKKFKMKIVPLNKEDYDKFLKAILADKIYVSNQDVQKYSSDGTFAVCPYDLDSINEQ